MKLARMIALATLAALAATPAATADDIPTYEWGVAYFMSYDNDLERCGKPILEGIRAGVASERTVAAVQADFSDAGGMRRFEILPGGKGEELRVPSEDSASEDAAVEYLEWFVKRFRCKRYAFTFLNHGGRIDQMCADERPVAASGAPAKPGAGGDTVGSARTKWMSGRVLGEKLRALREKTGAKVELLFLQQCGRGSLENLYSFRGTSEFIMSAPIPVGAPNTYYTAVHRWLGEPAAVTATGADLAAKIAAEDLHYTIYTCLETRKLDELPERLDAAIAPLLARPSLAPAPPQRVIHPVGEPIYDAAAYLGALSEANGGAAKDEIAAFFKWTAEELFVAPHATRRSSARSLCGLSIFAARSPREARRYAELALYRETKLPALWEKLAKPREPQVFSR